MTTLPFEISAQLVLTVLEDKVLVVAEENYVIVNFTDHAALERVMRNLLPPSAGKGGGGGIAGSLDKAKEVNQKLLEAGLVVDVRVNNKTYVELGTGASPRITANAVFGKVGSWFKKS
ncbi:hypothetical protein EFA69_17745 [Rufibacter immobilis]|uniref:Uncharacterized protein n=1 Tax=Rufibacter immobilis TaxID=1348778 RepID=A0A3M9MR01_9BACT|nr:hypothetical protein [Rufibacter immobilis]RNI27931.1 hypothetical protein EFA69_17745 [Rufibacter immobilis]